LITSLLVCGRPYVDYFAWKLVYEVLDVLLFLGLDDEDGMVDWCTEQVARNLIGTIDVEESLHHFHTMARGGFVGQHLLEMS